MSMTESPLRQLIEIQLGQTIHEFIFEANLTDASYRTIAVEIEKETGFRVSKSSLHNWLADEF